MNEIAKKNGQSVLPNYIKGFLLSEFWSKNFVLQILFWRFRRACVPVWHTQFEPQMVFSPVSFLRNSLLPLTICYDWTHILIPSHRCEIQGKRGSLAVLGKSHFQMMEIISEGKDWMEAYACAVCLQETRTEVDIMREKTQGSKEEESRGGGRLE